MSRQMNRRTARASLAVATALGIGATTLVVRADEPEQLPVIPADAVPAAVEDVTNVPEPTQLALLAIGGVLVMCRRRR